MKKPIIFLMLIFSFFAIFLAGDLNFGQATGYAASQEDKKSEPSISAKSALLVDYATGTVVMQKNVDERLPIASMTKLASLAVIFDALDKGHAKGNDLVCVSETAAAVGGSTAFLDAGSSYKLADLVKSVVIASANDSTVALAEHIAGSEDVFVSKMNKFASGLGLGNTHFENATGLPKQNHYSTANDIAKIYKTICNNPLYKKYSKIWMDDFIHPSGRRTGLVNTNKMIKTYDGIEGGKTGYTDSARFCLTASATRGNMRLIGVIIGADTSKTRFEEMTKLFNFGFSNYDNNVLVNSQIPVTIAKFKNAKNDAEIYPERDSVMFMQKSEKCEFTTNFCIDENIKAPLGEGDKVGKLFVFDENNMLVDEIDLVTRSEVEEQKFKDYYKKLIKNW